MPDRRNHRGAHPQDARLFAEAWHEPLRTAACELSWLLTRGYAEDSALALVGNRHNLTERQRMAVRRSACSDAALRRRTARVVTMEACNGQAVGIDGYNVLITVESALSGGPIFVARDGCYRDLASIHGTYRKVAETPAAVQLIRGFLDDAGVRTVDWTLDRPVSNSGRLKTLIAETVASARASWNIELVDDPDGVLADYHGIVASSDSWILDRCGRWLNLARELVDGFVPSAWKIAMADERVA